jgi:hypothetical protein
MPEIRVSPLGQNGQAFTRLNTVLVGAQTIDRVDPRTAIGIIAHELAHVIRGDVGQSRKNIEFATDRLAAKMLASKSPITSFITRGEVDFREEQAIWRATPGRASSWVAHLKDRAQKRMYGGYEARMGNVLATDLTDISEIGTHVRRYQDRLRGLNEFSAKGK